MKDENCVLFLAEMLHFCGANPIFLPMLRISCVSYLNAIPFVRGLKEVFAEEELALSLDVPGECAMKLQNGLVDVGLVPVAVIPQLPRHRIISDYCISSRGAVKTVLLLSRHALPDIREIYLDTQSRTSVELLRILCGDYWVIQPVFQPLDDMREEVYLAKDSVLLIGDKTFKAAQYYPYVYDLSYAWEQFCGKPFVFACWVGNQEVSPDLEKRFNAAFQCGLSKRPELFLQGYHDILTYAGVQEYLHQYIQYDFGDAQKDALQHFFKLIHLPFKNRLTIV